MHPTATETNSSSPTPLKPSPRASRGCRHPPLFAEGRTHYATCTCCPSTFAANRQDRIPNLRTPVRSWSPAPVDVRRQPSRVRSRVLSDFHPEAEFAGTHLGCLIGDPTPGQSRARPYHASAMRHAADDGSVDGVAVGGERNVDVASRRVRVRAHPMRCRDDLDRLLGILNLRQGHIELHRELEAAIVRG